MNLFNTIDNVMNACENDCDCVFYFCSARYWYCQTMSILNMWSKMGFCVIILCVVKHCGNTIFQQREDVLKGHRKIAPTAIELSVQSWDTPDNLASDMKEFLLSISCIAQTVDVLSTPCTPFKSHHNFLVPIHKLSVIWHFGIQIVHSIQSWDTLHYMYTSTSDHKKQMVTMRLGDIFCQNVYVICHMYICFHANVGKISIANEIDCLFSSFACIYSAHSRKF